jgi:hypothetical protein
MEYNSGRGQLIMPEHGRHIQKMIDYAGTVADRDERNKVAQAIVDVMGQLNPHLRDIVDFKHKLWDHLFIISEFKLDVDSPYPRPSAETLDIKPEKIKYPSNHIKFKHYGKTTELVINEIKKMEDGPRKDTMVANIANFMKMTYLTWNRDSVNDELIVEHLTELSNGELHLNANARLAQTNDILAKTMRKPVDKKMNNNNNRKPGQNNNNGKLNNNNNSLRKKR